MLRYSFWLTLLLSAVTAFPQTKPAAQKTKPFVLGVIDEVQSDVLGEKRLLNIYLPEGYNDDTKATFPVTYLLDGSADEDFIHVVGLFQFNSFSWINRVPPSIVVGIATVDRRRDFTFPTTIASDKTKYPTTGRSDKFIAFIKDELQPYIEKNYRTNGSKTLIGQSLGGLLAAQILIEKPSFFNKYIIVSPSIWWDNGSLLERNFTQIQRISQPTDIYIAVGKEGLTPTEPPRVMEVDANVLADQIRALKNPAVHVYFDYLPDEDHATIMHRAVSNGLHALYPKQ